LYRSVIRFRCISNQKVASVVSIQYSSGSKSRHAPIRKISALGYWNGIVEWSSTRPIMVYL
ncbi:AAEL014565-PA, partial [Aedes aegypti]